MPKHKEKKWWTSAVTYQIYPRSFFDSSGDGNGDLRGVIEKLDYIKDLGVDAIWLNPVFESPWEDGGYDPSSYEKVDKKFGSQQDLYDLISSAHEKNIKVILDLVANHTSDQHPWFIEVKSKKMHKRRIASKYDYKKDQHANLYTIRPADPENPDKPPNNWLNFFKESSAWAKIPETGEWYLHKFSPHQPDLTHHNPLVMKLFKKIIENWLKMGIDGIRLDVIDLIFEDETLADFEPNHNPAGSYYMDKWKWQDRFLQYKNALSISKEISETIKKYNKDAVSIGEIYYNDDVSDFLYLRGYHEKGELDLPFNFSLLHTMNRYGANAQKYKKIVDKYLEVLPKDECPNFVISNHDQYKRIADKVGSNLRSVTLMLFTLGNSSGSNIFIYMGEELGMIKGEIISEKNMKDPQGINLGLENSRDNVRTGYVWSRYKKNSGFSESQSPWLPGGITSDGNGYEEQMEDPESQLNLTKKIIQLRKTNNALIYGEYVPLDSHDEQVFIFGRNSFEKNNSQFLIIAVNFSSHSKTIKLPATQNKGKIIFSTKKVNEDEEKEVDKNIYLHPHEGCIIRLD